MHPEILRIGPFALRSYSALIIVGFVVALAYTMAMARRRSGADGIKPEHMFDVSLGGLVAGIIGTRVLYVAANWQEFAGKWWTAAATWNGGLSFLGAPLFGLGYGWWWARRRNLPFAAMADLAAPGIALGSAFGRVGCFLNGCCYGYPCDLPWAVRFRGEGSLTWFTPPSHPAQLYDALLQLGVFIALHTALVRPHARGQIVLGYVALYCVARAVSEQFRRGATVTVVALGLTQAQWVCLLVLPLAVAALVWVGRRQRVTSSPAG